MRALLIWWRARRAYRRGLCRWCRDPILGDPARTLYGAPVHHGCREDADDHDHEGTLW